MCDGCIGSLNGSCGVILSSPLEALLEPPRIWRQPSYLPLRNSLICLTAPDSRSFGLDLVFFRLRMILCILSRMKCYVLLDVLASHV